MLCVRNINAVGLYTSASLLCYVSRLQTISGAVIPRESHLVQWIARSLLEQNILFLEELTLLCGQTAALRTGVVNRDWRHNYKNRDQRKTSVLKTGQGQKLCGPGQGPHCQAQDKDKDFVIKDQNKDLCVEDGTRTITFWIRITTRTSLSNTGQGQGLCDQWPRKHLCISYQGHDKDKNFVEHNQDMTCVSRTGQDKDKNFVIHDQDNGFSFKHRARKNTLWPGSGQWPVCRFDTLTVEDRTGTSAGLTLAQVAHRSSGAS